MSDNFYTEISDYVANLQTFRYSSIWATPNCPGSSSFAPTLYPRVTFTCGLLVFLWRTQRSLLGRENSSKINFVFKYCQRIVCGKEIKLSYLRVSYKVKREGISLFIWYGNKLFFVISDFNFKWIKKILLFFLVQVFL